MSRGGVRWGRRWSHVIAHHDAGQHRPNVTDDPLHDARLLFGRRFPVVHCGWHLNRYRHRMIGSTGWPRAANRIIRHWPVCAISVVGRGRRVIWRIFFKKKENKKKEKIGNFVHSVTFGGVSCESLLLYAKKNQFVKIRQILYLIQYLSYKKIHK